MEDEKPPVRRLTLKPKEVIPTDQVARPGDGTAISVQLMHRENKLADDKREGVEPDSEAPYPGAAPSPAAVPFQPAPADAEPGETPQPPADEPMEVGDMLRANQMAANEAEGLIAMPPPRRSRRRQDFMVLLGLAAGATAVLMVVFRQDEQVMALGMFAIVFLTVILAWVMFGIMDKY
jgi:hypothetical protein